MTTLTLVLTAVGSVLLLLFLVMKARMHAFLALMVVSMGAGLFSGMPLDKIAATMEKGMGGTLGFLAVVVALGAMFGKILVKGKRGEEKTSARAKSKHGKDDSKRVGLNK